MEYSKGPQNVTDPNDLEGYAALRGGAAIVDRSDRKLLRLTGKDPVGMLNAVLTNDVPTHGDGGLYAMLLDPKGRVRTDLRVVKDGDGILVDTEPEGAGAAKEILGRYAPFSRVSLEELSDRAVLGLYGPQATELLGNPDLAEHETTRAEIGGAPVIVVGVAVPIGGYDLIGSQEALAAAREHLTEAGARSARTDAYETVRIEAGVPRFGADITTENFPGESETSLQRAINFGRAATRARRRWRGCITVAARTRNSTASSWSPARWNRRRREMRSCRAKRSWWAQSPQRVSSAGLLRLPRRS